MAGCTVLAALHSTIHSPPRPFGKRKPLPGLLIAKVMEFLSRPRLIWLLRISEAIYLQTTRPERVNGPAPPELRSPGGGTPTGISQVNPGGLDETFAKFSKYGGTRMI